MATKHEKSPRQPERLRLLKMFNGNSTYAAQRAVHSCGVFRNRYGHFGHIDQPMP